MVFAYSSFPEENSRAIFKVCDNKLAVGLNSTQPFSLKILSK
jgi:hypothetical protein